MEFIRKCFEWVYDNPMEFLFIVGAGIPFFVLVWTIAIGFILYTAGQLC